MEATFADWLQWLESTEAAVGLVLAVTGGLFSAWFTWHQRTLARRERAADLFDRFYSLESYHAMVAPVYVITLKWNALEGEARAAFAGAICRGWAGPDRAGELIAAWDPDHDSESAEASVEVFEAAHFRHPYAIYAQFLADFRQAVLDNPDTSAGRPAWIEATEELERFLLGEELEAERLDGSGARPSLSLTGRRAPPA